MKTRLINLSAILLSSVILAGCASSSPQANVISKPDPTNSMLFGQIAIPDTFNDSESRKLAHKKMRDLCNGDYVLDDEIYRVTIDTKVGKMTATSPNRINRDGVKEKGLLFRCKQ